ncbi:TetR/AcrR family transcriptional regulator [Streptomyces sp. NRRL WC-3742]|uniref:TetR/AcrR family transcriptional regulator n=1 Tax=Streptomyces sp. NRRL WC-3742 TaxID=1463934 RepID=UPI0004CAA9E0|nr:TetR family transcriptional regulator C-terminal domain-containing protein [Streptomyces sp. NRRL WC-3742]
MPRQVDHEERRRRIAEAVCALIDERGLEGATLRDVAARAEVSMGAVQRCFRTKEEMLRFALAHIGTRITDRVRARPAEDALAHAVTEVALLREEHRAEARIWLAFVARAAVNPALAEVLRTGYEEFEQVLHRLLAEAGAADPRREARTLLALADGLTAQVLVGRLGAGEAEELLIGQLGRAVRGR